MTETKIITSLDMLTAFIDLLGNIPPDVLANTKAQYLAERGVDIDELLKKHQVMAEHAKHDNYHEFCHMLERMKTSL